MAITLEEWAKQVDEQLAKLGEDLFTLADRLGVQLVEDEDEGDG